MRKDHAAAAPVAGGVRPGARRCIAHTELLRQGQRNAALLQVGVATAPRQGGLERGELLGQVGPRWRGRTRCWWICGALPGCCRWLPGKPRWRLATVWYALPAGRRPPEGRLALLLLTPLRPRRFHVAPGTTGKAHEAAAAHLHAQAALAVRAVEGTSARSTWPPSPTIGRQAARSASLSVKFSRSVSPDMFMSAPPPASCPDQAGRSARLSPYRRAGSLRRSAPPPAPAGSPNAPGLPSGTAPHPPRTPGHRFL